MTKQHIPRSPYPLLVCCLLSGLAHAQSIRLSGDSTPRAHGSPSDIATRVSVGPSGMDTLAIHHGGQRVPQDATTNQQSASKETPSAESSNASRESGETTWALRSALFTGLPAGDTESGTLQQRSRSSASSRQAMPYTAATLATQRLVKDADAPSRQRQPPRCRRWMRWAQWGWTHRHRAWRFWACTTRGAAPKRRR